MSCKLEVNTERNSIGINTTDQKASKSRCLLVDGWPRLHIGVPQPINTAVKTRCAIMSCEMKPSFISDSYMDIRLAQTGFIQHPNAYLVMSRALRARCPYATLPWPWSLRLFCLHSAPTSYLPDWLRGESYLSSFVTVSLCCDAWSLSQWLTTSPMLEWIIVIYHHAMMRTPTDMSTCLGSQWLCGCSMTYPWTVYANTHPHADNMVLALELVSIEDQSSYQSHDSQGWLASLLSGAVELQNLVQYHSALSVLQTVCTTGADAITVWNQSEPSTNDRQRIESNAIDTLRILKHVYYMRKKHKRFG